MYIYIYTQYVQEAQLIELKATQKNGRIIYVAKRKKCKKSVLWAAAYNKIHYNQIQLPMFILKPFNCCEAKNGKK